MYDGWAGLVYEVGISVLLLLHTPYIHMKTIAFQCLFDMVESTNFFL